MKQSEVRTHINGQWRKAGERSAARACVGRNRLQTGRHTLCRGGQIHGHPSTHSPANSTDTLRSSPSRARPGNGRTPGCSAHLDRSDVTTSSNNLVIGFRGRSHTIHSPSPTCFPDDVLAGSRTTASLAWLTLPKLPECGRVAARHAEADDYTDTISPIPLPHR